MDAATFIVLAIVCAVAVVAVILLVTEPPDGGQGEL